MSPSWGLLASTVRAVASSLGRQDLQGLVSSRRCPSVQPQEWVPRSLILTVPRRRAPEAAPQASEMLSNSCMRGVAKGWMSWMRSSRWVCWALMLRSSVSLAMIFRNRNLQAGQREGWGAAHPGPTYRPWTTPKSPKFGGFRLRIFQVSPGKGSVELLVFHPVGKKAGQPGGREVLLPRAPLESMYGRYPWEHPGISGTKCIGQFVGKCLPWLMAVGRTECRGYGSSHLFWI